MHLLLIRLEAKVFSDIGLVLDVNTNLFADDQLFFLLMPYFILNCAVL